MDTALTEAIVREIESLPAERRADALKAVRALGRRRATPGSALIPSFGSISEEDARAMERAIEEECERIDSDAW